MARRFAARGRDLALCARRTERLDALRHDLLAAYPTLRVAIRSLDVDDHNAVPRVFGELTEEIGGLDRVIVNAGIGKGTPLGTGNPWANVATLQTNLVSALVQAEAALSAFRAQNAGHLVLISSMSADRGMPKAQSAYAAGKAGLSALGQGLAIEFASSPIAISTIQPGYIRTAINEGVDAGALMTGTEKGVDALVKAIEREPVRACVPAWPWTAIDLAMRHLPEPVLRRLIPG
jgi:short-subunit dehydrogenase